MVRVVLVAVLAVAPLLAAAFGRHQIEVTDALALTYNGAAFTFLLAGLLAAVLGVVSYRHMDDRRGVPLSADLAAAFHSEPVGLHGSRPAQGLLRRARGRRGRRQVDPGPGAGRLARGAGPRRRGDLRAGRHRGRPPAALGAARPPGAAAEGEAADVPPPCRRAPRRCCSPPTAPSTWRPSCAPALALGARRGHRPLHRLLGRLPGRRPRAVRHRGGPAVAVGHRRPAARPDRRARRAGRRRAGPGRGAGPAGVRADRVPRAGPRAVPRAGPARRLALPRRRRARCRPTRSPRRSGPGSSRCCR